VKKHLRWKSNT